MHHISQHLSESFAHQLSSQSWTYKVRGSVNCWELVGLRTANMFKWMAWPCMAPYGRPCSSRSRWFSTSILLPGRAILGGKLLPHFNAVDGGGHQAKWPTCSVDAHGQPVLRSLPLESSCPQNVAFGNILVFCRKCIGACESV